MKIYIRAMSIKKDEALRQLSSLSSTIIEHLIKLVVYSDIRQDDITGWVKTVARCIYRADNITLKPNARKLKPADIMNSLFSSIGDELSDYELALEVFKQANRQGKFNYEDKVCYPDFDVTQQLAVALMTVCYSVVDNTMPLLLDKQAHSLFDYEFAVKEAINQI